MAKRKIDPWIERLEWVMDRSIPVGRWSFGLDPILDLIPGIGDALGTVVSMTVILRGMHVGLPKSAIARMMVNIGIDTVVGAIPIIGNVFDFAFKSNTRNVRIYRSALAGERRARADWGFVLLIAVLFAAIVSVPFLILFWVIYRFGWF